MQLTKKILLPVLTCSIFLIPTLVGAEGTTTPQTIKQEIERKREAIKKEAETKREAIKDQAESKREELKEKMEEKREAVGAKVKERLADFVDKIENRFNAAIERLENLAGRIDSRIAKMDTEGKDTTKAKELLATAKVKIAEAKASVALIGPKADEVVAGDTRTLFPELKEIVENAKQDIKEAHEALVEVIKNLKPGRMDKATTTPAANTSPTN